MIRQLPVLSRCRRRENRFIAPITIAAVCFFFFFFLLGPLRLSDVALHSAAWKSSLCFALSLGRY